MCDKLCVGWKSRNVCAHCLAVAEDNTEKLSPLVLQIHLAVQISLT